MPALTAIITGNARQLNQELDKSLRTAEKWAKDMKRGMGGGGEYASVLTQGDVKKALEGVGEAAHGAHIPVRGLSHLFSELGVKGSGATSIIVHAFKNPIFLAIAAAAGALWLFNKALQALGPVADTLGTKSLAPQMETLQSGWTATAQPPHVVIISGTNSTNDNFGNTQHPKSRLGNWWNRSF